MKLLIVNLLLVAMTAAQCSAPSTSGVNATAISAPVSQEKTASLYLNAVQYFPDTDEFYVTVSRKDTIADFDWEGISSQADSIVNEGEEEVRYKLPMKVAEQVFDLSLLDTVDIYDATHHRIARAKFAGVEYYDKPIESEFIVVLKPFGRTGSAKSGVYCMSPLKASLAKMTSEVIDDTLIAKKIQQELKINVNYLWQVNHIRVKETSSVFSTFACLTPEGNLSYLTELKDGKLNLLYKFKQEDSFWGVFPVPVYTYGKPVLLVTLAVPDSDRGLVYIPFEYDGKSYHYSWNNRIAFEE